MKHTIAIFIIFISSLDLYAQRDSVYISKVNKDTAVWTIYELNDGTIWTFYQSHGKRSGFLNTAITSAWTHTFMPWDTTRPYSDSIISIVNTDSSLIIQVNIISTGFWSNDFEGYIINLEPGILNLGYHNVSQVRNSEPISYYLVCVTFHFSKTGSNSVQSLTLNGNLETMKSIN